MDTAISPGRPAVDPVRDETPQSRSAATAPETTPALVSCDPYARLATRILEYGEPCRAAVLRVQVLGLRNASGQEMYALLLTLLDGVGSGCPIWVGDSVPGGALKLLRRGSVLPAKRLPDGDERDIAIDWQLAVQRRAAHAA
jgi:hypothetical protein